MGAFYCVLQSFETRLEFTISRGRTGRCIDVFREAVGPSHFFQQHDAIEGFDALLLERHSHPDLQRTKQSGGSRAMCSETPGVEVNVLVVGELSGGRCGLEL